MIYIDSNIFIYAYFKPKKGKVLSDKIKWCKGEAKKIIQNINKEENSYSISLIQLSEVVNLLKSAMTWEKLQKFIMGLISNKAIRIVEMSKLMYIHAITKMEDYKMDANDISAYLLMKENNIKEIYTFDSHFESLSGILCLPRIPEKFQ